MSINSKQIRKFLNKNKQSITGLCVGILITILIGAFALITHGNSRSKPLSKVTTVKTNDINNTSSANSSLDNLPQDNSANSSSTDSSSTGNQTSTRKVGNTNNNTPSIATPTPAPMPTQRAPYSFTFASGNITAQWYSGGTFFNNSYTDEWVHLTSATNSTGLSNFKFSFNCSTNSSACPGIYIQASHDGSSWINYQTLSTWSGNYTYPALYEYYRLLLSSGGCSSNACPANNPPSNGVSYELTAVGYFY